jgi:archaellum biogenesis protein FlaJ (TadC family)
LGLAGLLTLAVAIVARWPILIPWAVLATGAGYLIGREGRAVVDGWAAVVGVLLLLSAELASWSIEHDARIHTERRLLARRIGTLAALTVGALLVNFLLLGAAALSAPAGVVLAAAGVGAAVLAVGVVLRLVR